MYKTFNEYLNDHKKLGQDVFTLEVKKVVDAYYFYYMPHCKAVITKFTLWIKYNIAGSINKNNLYAAISEIIRNKIPWQSAERDKKFLEECLCRIDVSYIEQVLELYQKLENYIYNQFKN